MTWNMLEPAKIVASALEGLSDQKLPHEILLLDDDTSFLIVDIAGVDYGLTMIKAPNQRERETTN